MCMVRCQEDKQPGSNRQSPNVITRASLRCSSYHEVVYTSDNQKKRVQHLFWKSVLSHPDIFPYSTHNVYNVPQCIIWKDPVGQTKQSLFLTVVYPILQMIIWPNLFCHCIYSFSFSSSALAPPTQHIFVIPMRLLGLK